MDKKALDIVDVLRQQVTRLMRLDMNADAIMTIMLRHDPAFREKFRSKLPASISEQDKDRIVQYATDVLEYYKRNSAQAATSSTGSVSTSVKVFPLSVVQLNEVNPVGVNNGGAVDRAMQNNIIDRRTAVIPNQGIVQPLGGIDLNSANLDLYIKRDDKGVPLPVAQQDWAQLQNIPGFVPVIIEIKPAISLPILSDLQTSAASVS